MKLKYWFIFFLMLLGLQWSSVYSADITVMADRNPVSLNESFRLIFSTSGSVDDDPDFSPLNKYFDVMNRSQSSNIQILNGDYNSSKTWTLTVMAKKVGEIIVPPISFGSDESQSYKIRITEKASGGKADAEFFTRIKSDQKNVSVQQQIVITQQMFSAKNLSAYGMDELNIQGVDVLIEALGDEKQYQTEIGDRAFLVVEKKFAVFPQTSGKLSIAPAFAEARLGSSNSFFGGFGGNKVVRARSNALSLDVKPIPDHVSFSPWLPAQKLEIEEQWPSKIPEFVEGEPLTRTLSIKAVGLTAAQIPELTPQSIEGIKQYPDQPLLKNISNDSGITGYRVEKVAFIPTRSGEMVLPGIEINWWNTKSRKIEKARVPSRRIKVKAASSGNVPAVQVKPESALSDSLAQNPVPDRHDESSDSTISDAGDVMIWKILAGVLAGIWLLTLGLWLLYTRKNKPSVNKTSLPAEDLKSSYSAALKACDAGDAVACRSAIQDWLENLFPQKNARSLGEYLAGLSPELSAEIKKMEAMLYGGQQAEIDYKTIRQQLEQMMKQAKKPEPRDEIMLEPLYK